MPSAGDFITLLKVAIEFEFGKRKGNLEIGGRFSFGEGINVILGSNGSGKTTTLRVMAGLERPDRGYMKCCREVFFDTERGIFLPPQRRRVGLIFQEDNLLPHLTVKENVEFGSRKAKVRIDVNSLLEDFGLKDLENRYPHELSGGQRQKVAIVRAIAYRPRALLMDEPFSSLDFRTKLEIIDFIKKIPADMPIVIVTHDPLEAFLLAEKVFLMEKGKKVAEGGKELIKEFFSNLNLFNLIQ